MSIQDYIKKQQQRPEHERRRLAVIWTAAAFVVILVIWVVSFREMNKPAEVQADPSAASLNDLKNNFNQGKDSIENMMQQMPASPTGGPSQTAPADNTDTTSGSDSLNTGNNNQMPADSSDNNGNQINPSVPQLP
jgi:heme/copper-type cytochrome/quinol oxidase subunit 2